MPPGQSLTEKFPMLTYEGTSEWPSTDLRGWDLHVYGEVENPMQFDIEGLARQFEVVDLTFDIHCVTRWSKLGRDVLEKAKPTPQARYLISHSSTGYTANVPLESALPPDSLITWEYDGRPLPPEHGGPVRGIIDPRHLYFWKSAKFLNDLELAADDQPGFWERLGYNNRGNIWAEERFWSDSDLHTRRDVIRRAEEERN